ncbi:L domain-like protein [Anaeromyces robustus]|uniref:L domain-like protein n=1 Tax=Anaeromyces robustus TaxID=1754192 RepID=A0A1Y1XPX0_9FUNG|nr:L domain-like protein [Anaeromyces robustus]|eukprot:ORX87798.1 L domain-like protein [Anaeromyces robustus]
MKFIKIFEIFAINFLIVVSQQLNLKQQCNDIKAFFTNNQIITTENKNSCCGVFEISCGADKNNVNTVKFRTFEPKIIDFTQFPAVQNIEIIATSNILFNNNQLPKLLLDPNLKELDILNSNLNVVPNDIANLMKLEKLMINDSKITSVPYFLKNLPNLKYLSIRNNTMTISLTNEMSEFKTLETLDISVNRFEEPLVLPLNLKILKMEGCRMKTLDTEMLKQLHLEYK